MSANAPSPLHNVGLWTTRRAEIAGATPALSDAQRSLDYRAFHERVCRLVAVLRAHAVGTGDRVALLLGNRTAYLEAIFATARLGAIAVPVNARFTAPEVQRVFDDCRPRLLLYEESLAEVARAARDAAAHTPAALACPSAYEVALARVVPDAHVEPVSPEAPMILMYTSGTTGVPKGALLPHRKTLYNSLNAELFFGLRDDDRVLVALPLFHSFGLLILSLPTLYAGGHVVLEPRFEAARVWEQVQARCITFLGGVPTQLQALLDAEPSRYETSSLRFVFGAGAAVPVELIRGFEAEGLVLKQGFGQTETSILCCLDSRDALRKAGSVGRPVFHAEIRVVDPTTLGGAPAAWRDVAVGEAGEIVVRGPITMLGYWERPQETAETLRDDWVLTRDRAVVDDEGYLTLVGRAGDMYISGGENVYPAEIEAALEAHPDVAEIAILGIPHQRWGETGRAYVVPASGATLSREALAGFAAERLARFKLPSEWVEIRALPRTETGKVQKHQLEGLDAKPIA
jgi:fatty-acyl-CoA synthase